ncbi:MAG TPA: family 43 glycosylhydrolase [Candidatus Brocadiia bacterium]|nr:family 43 glycosylhydrolase [Candidatus Brocadiia bacterium]
MNLIPPTLILLLLGAAESSPEPQPPPPPVFKLFDTPLRDTSICLAPDGFYYLTGTVQPFWDFNEGIRLWKSPDLVHWESLGMVWRYGDSPWHKKYLEARKPIWAPEIHYLKGAFWLTYSMPGWDGTAKTSGCGLLRSATGKPEGPYADVQPNERMGDEIDATLFEDSDGAVYFVWHCGKIARMKPDMSGLAEPYVRLRTTSTDPAPNHHSNLCKGIFGADSFDHVGYEGVFLFKANNLYHLACAEMIDGRYHCMVATSSDIKGPYSERRILVPDAGHATLFQDKSGAWWCTFFGNGKPAPQIELPGLVPMRFDAAGLMRPCLSLPSSLHLFER